MRFFSAENQHVREKRARPAGSCVWDGFLQQERGTKLQWKLHPFPSGIYLYVHYIITILFKYCRNYTWKGLHLSSHGWDFSLDRCRHWLDQEVVHGKRARRKCLARRATSFWMSKIIKTWGCFLRFRLVVHYFRNSSMKIRFFHDTDADLQIGTLATSCLVD